MDGALNDVSNLRGAGVPASALYPGLSPQALGLRPEG
jgi:hypothetical protein